MVIRHNTPIIMRSVTGIFPEIGLKKWQHLQLIKNAYYVSLHTAPSRTLVYLCIFQAKVAHVHLN